MDDDKARYMRPRALSGAVTLEFADELPWLPLLGHLIRVETSNGLALEFVCPEMALEAGVPEIELGGTLLEFIGRGCTLDRLEVAASAFPPGVARDHVRDLKAVFPNAHIGVQGANSTIGAEVTDEPTA